MWIDLLFFLWCSRGDKFNRAILFWIVMIQSSDVIYLHNHEWGEMWNSSWCAKTEQSVWCSIVGYYMCVCIGIIRFIFLNMFSLNGYFQMVVVSSIMRNMCTVWLLLMYIFILFVNACWFFVGFPLLTLLQHLHIQN